MPRARELQKSVIFAPPLLSATASKCTPLYHVRQVCFIPKKTKSRRVSGCIGGGGGYRPRLATSPPLGRGLGTASRLAETTRSAPALITSRMQSSVHAHLTNKKTALRQFLLWRWRVMSPRPKKVW
jgi:hypothetical protein